jgi:hypothetical protein
MAMYLPGALLILVALQAAAIVALLIRQARRDRSGEAVVQIGEAKGSRH